ncbi:hypothetical protein Golomagni_07216 [Golovinomyces magnicellulatus]|nr:hypothetical protein Golomagni_07216 [Golovinomyces magnicellulatus]
MFKTPPRLQVRRPSPTTVEFTVTTLPPQTVALRLAQLLLFICRILLALTIILQLHACWSVSPWANPWPSSPIPKPLLPWSLDSTRWLLDTIHRFAPIFTQIAQAVPAWILVPVSLAIFYLLGLRVHSQERLLVMRGLGVQTSQSSKSYWAGKATRFIPTEKIQDILINEAFRGFEVRSGKRTGFGGCVPWLVTQAGDS